MEIIVNNEEALIYHASLAGRKFRQKTNWRSKIVKKKKSSEAYISSAQEHTPKPHPSLAALNSRAGIIVHARAANSRAALRNAALGAQHAYRKSFIFAESMCVRARALLSRAREFSVSRYYVYTPAAGWPRAQPKISLPHPPLPPLTHFGPRAAAPD